MNQYTDCILVKKDNASLLDLIEETYNASFPESERRAFYLVRELMNNTLNFTIYALLKEETYIGFITAWHFVNFIYVEHFAIDAAHRNGGIGTDGMKQFLSFCDVPVVLEVEIPVNEISRRRIGFYERLGFVLDDHLYYQPPYRKEEDKIEMRLMTYNVSGLKLLFEDVKNKIYSHVYKIT